MLPFFQGRAFDVLYGSNQVTLQVGDANWLAADFDEDLDVDGDNLARWRNGFSASLSHLRCEADGDGDVDGADFLAWLRELGLSRLYPTSHTVPEAASLSCY